MKLLNALSLTFALALAAHAQPRLPAVPEELLEGVDPAILERSWKPIPPIQAARETGEAAEPSCYSLRREVFWKGAGEPESSFKQWGFQKGHLSERTLPNIVGIMTPWSHKVRAELLWMTELRLVSGGLRMKLALEKNDFPMDDNWEVVWERQEVFPLGQERVFASSIEDRDFKIAVLFSEEKNRKLCALPKFPPPP